MLVYDLSQRESQTVYVNAETGRLRRVDFNRGTIDYHSWGAVDEIQPPEMDCQSPPEE